MLSEEQAWYQGWPVTKSFPGHKGRPGQHGGSLPREGLKVSLSLMYDMTPNAKAGLEAMVGRLPESHQQIVSRWAFVAMGEETDTAEEVWMSLFVNPNDKEAHEMGLKGSVNIVAGALVRQNPAIYHELGHLVYDAEKSKSLKGWSHSLAKGMKPLGRRHPQARKRAEWFSDAYELYFSDKAALEDLSPEVSAFMHAVIENA